MITDSIVSRFWPKVRVTPGCWEWTASRQTSGYGQMGRGPAGSGIVLAHRVSYEIHHGEIPAGLVVRHKCDNRICVNPDHLKVGTYADNRQDMVERGRERHPAGVDAWNSKLTPDQVAAIRAVPKYKSVRHLAERFGISHKYAVDLRSKNHPNWKGVSA